MSRKAYYDLSIKPATFDFVTWVCNAKTLGATEIVFDVSKGFQKKKFSADIARQMYENVLKPACELWGLPHSEGTQGDFTPGYFFSDLLDTFGNYGRIVKPVDVTPTRDRHTVTLRDSIRNKGRDSNRREWLMFAERIGAVVIDDAYREQISLGRRYSMYCGAEMNYFVTNGPMVLCMFSDAPYTVFAKEPMVQQQWVGQAPFQLPWANEDQRIVWRDDSYENIRSEWAGRNTRSPAEAPAL